MNLNWSAQLLAENPEFMKDAQTFFAFTPAEKSPLKRFIMSLAQKAPYGGLESPTSNDLALVAAKFLANQNPYVAVEVSTPEGSETRWMLAHKGKHDHQQITCCEMTAMKEMLAQRGDSKMSRRGFIKTGVRAAASTAAAVTGIEYLKHQAVSNALKRLKGTILEKIPSEMNVGARFAEEEAVKSADTLAEKESNKSTACFLAVIAEVVFARQLLNKLNDANQNDAHLEFKTILQEADTALGEAIRQTAPPKFEAPAR